MTIEQFNELRYIIELIDLERDEIELGVGGTPTGG